MPYEAEFLFFTALLKNLQLSVYLLQEPFDITFDYGLRHLIAPETDYQKLLRSMSDTCVERCIYQVTDEFLCNYILLRLPDIAPVSFILIGPYTLTGLTPSNLMQHKIHAPAPEQLSQLEKFCREIPMIPDNGILLAAVNTFGARIWGGMDNFTMEHIQYFPDPGLTCSQQQEPVSKPEEPFLSMEILEQRYSKENELMQAVSKGQMHRIEMMKSTLGIQHMEQRLADPVRNMKNYTIILNTILRKAAEAGAVHPIHIDRLSSQFARKIELIVSGENCVALQKEMIHKYCLLVKNHSMKGYSLLVRKVLTHIDSDLTADLSLSAQAQLLNVNSSYLSTLFKKETGSTLTEYVNLKRIEHAIFLLNSTALQIQTIAQYCGIPDVNYFTKTFKKMIGKTPKEYRDSIASYPIPL